MVNVETIHAVVAMSVAASEYLGRPVILQLGTPTEKQLRYRKASPRAVNVRIHSLKSGKHYGFRLEETETGIRIEEWSPGFRKRLGFLPGEAIPEEILEKIVKLARSARAKNLLLDKFVKVEREPGAYRVLESRVRAALEKEKVRIPEKREVQ